MENRVGGRPRKYKYKVGYGAKATLKCHQCGKTFTRYASVIRGSSHGSYPKRVFCGNVCKGKWLGTNIGRYVWSKYRHMKAIGMVGYRYIAEQIGKSDNHRFILIKLAPFTRDSKSLCCSSKVVKDSLYKNTFWCMKCDKKVFTWRNEPILEDY